MTTKMRSLRNFRNPIGCLILLAAFAAAAGCSTAESPGGSSTNMNHVLPSGSSVAGWLVTPSGGAHASTATLDYIANNGSSGCTQCHGSDLSGGISGVSCFGNTAGCHHGPVTGWVAAPPAAQQHGVSAKKAPGSSGFASCQICHGADFRTVRGGMTCFTCHTLTPHAPRPWRGSLYTHTNTDTGNAPVCAQCHYPGSPNNPAGHPATPAPAGTAPGCFNSTLCHEAGGAPHSVGSTWVATSPAAQPHGTSAKATPGTTAGYAYCQICHGTGTNFSGGSSGVSCYPCHVPTANSPHASQWRTGDTYVHTTTATGNATVCAFCHLNGANSPIAPPSPPAPAGTAAGCFNSTLCHGAAGAPHPVGSTWVATSPAAQPHGTSAKATPGTTAGYAYCQICHGTGTNFSGGSSGVSCYPCHVPTAISPHASQWRTGDTYVHTTTATGNATVCAYCHLNGAISPIAPPSPPAPAGTAPGCFNSTLCHGTGGVAHAVPFNDPAHYAVDNAAFATSCGACHAISAPSVGPACRTCHVAGNPVASPPLASCTSCHASPPNGGAPAGAVYANIAGAHAAHIALTSAGTPISCDTCHSGLGPSLLNLNHYNRAKSRLSPGDVLFDSSYLAESGTRSFDNVSTSGTYLTCNAVSCHGGQRTPNWQTGALDVNTQCTNCHAQGTAQYNSFNSGEHPKHIAALGLSAATCKLCHNTTTLAVNHFSVLGTTEMEGPASATIGGAGTLVNTWNPVTKSCTPTCHSAETW